MLRAKSEVKERRRSMSSSSKTVMLQRRDLELSSSNRLISRWLLKEIASSRHFNTTMWWKLVLIFSTLQRKSKSSSNSCKSLKRIELWYAPRTRVRQQSLHLLRDYCLRSQSMWYFENVVLKPQEYEQYLIESKMSWLIKFLRVKISKVHTA